MISVSDVKWGSYSGYCGPYFMGSRKYQRPEEETLEDKYLYVVASTESVDACLDAVNAYDSCIMSVGLIQLCDASQMSVCNLLGEVDKEHPEALDSLRGFVGERGYTFGNYGGSYRYKHITNGIVNTVSAQRFLYLLNSDGKVWDDASKDWAKRFVVEMANIWDHDGASQVQCRFLSNRIKRYTMPFSKKYLFTGEEGDWYEACRAVFLSFAANNPTWADAAVQKVAARDGFKWTSEWIEHFVSTLTYNKGIKIYPERYEKVRRAVKEVFELELPEAKPELAAL